MIPVPIIASVIGAVDGGLVGASSGKAGLLLQLQFD